MHSKKKQLALGLALVAALGLTSCTSDDAGPGLGGDAAVATKHGLVIDGELIADAKLYEAAKDQTLVLYTSYQEPSEVEFLKAFTHDTGIEVDMVRLVPAQLAERVLAEAGAGKLPADIIRISDYQLVQQLEAQGIWERYVPSTSEGLDDVVVEDGQVVRVLTPVMTFAYNTNLVSEEEAPTSWAELASPQWAGQLSFIRGTAGGVMDAANRFLASEVSPDFWNDIAALEPVIYDGGAQAAEAVAKGEVMVGHSGTAAVNLMVTNDGAPIRYVIPEEGLVTFDYYLGLTSTGTNVEAAKVFSNYNLSRRGQTVFSKVGDYAVRTDVAPPTSLGVTLPTIDSGKVWKLSTDDAGLIESDRAAWAEAFNR